MEITELNGRFSIAERGTAGILYLIVVAFISLILVPINVIIWIIFSIKTLIFGVNGNGYKSNYYGLISMLGFLGVLLLMLPSIIFNQHYYNKYNNLDDLSFSMSSVSIYSQGLQSDINFHIEMENQPKELKTFDAYIWVLYDSKYYSLCEFNSSGTTRMLLSRNTTDGPYKLFHQKSSEIYNLNYYIAYKKATLKNGKFDFKYDKKKFDWNNMDITAYYFYKQVTINVQ